MTTSDGGQNNCLMASAVTEDSIQVGESACRAGQLKITEEERPFKIREHGIFYKIILRAFSIHRLTLWWGKGPREGRARYK